MSLSPKNKYYLKRILPFGVIWLLFGMLFLWVEYAALGNQYNTPDSAIQLSSDVLTFALIGIALIGLLVGCIEVFLLDRLFENKPLGVKLISKFLIYALFFEGVISITFPMAASIELDTSFFNTRVWDKYVVFFFSITHLSAVVQLSFSLLASLFYSEMSQHMGQHVLLNFFTGKYHKPVVEARIFMFVDMKDSTTIAEKLGHKAYFKLLRSYYAEFSEAIIKNQGQVYQYVGDEIVITWPLDQGLKNNQCVQCFYDMQNDLSKKESTYLKKYKLAPSFKAALHYGKVTTGEIGALKKDIFFTGDVLNTTARILGLTSTFKEDVLISTALSRKLNLTQKYTLTPLGAPPLKGKADAVEIAAIHKIS
ncbi:MAG: adenylate/guanylate cyclase domain-containing protein [Cytophagaceae bacterium]|nr:adenylate/guanylate cyclase domain-containing protein [Cytophagaceae bacterium]